MKFCYPEAGGATWSRRFGLVGRCGGGPARVASDGAVALWSASFGRAAAVPAWLVPAPPGDQGAAALRKAVA